MDLIPAKIKMYDFHRSYMPEQAQQIYVPDPKKDFEIFVDYLADEIFKGKSAKFRSSLQDIHVLPWQQKYINEYWQLEIALPSGEFMSDYLKTYEDTYVHSASDFSKFVENQEKIAKVVYHNILEGVS